MSTTEAENKSAADTEAVVRADGSVRADGTVGATGLHSNLGSPYFRRAVFGAVLLVLVALPLFLDPYPLSLAGRALAFGLLVISVDLLTGFMGMATLGQVAFFGAGAYVSGLVAINVSTNAFLQLGIGAGAGALLALVAGTVAVRTSGIIFLMVTLAVGELAHQGADTMTVTGGSNGLAGIPPLTLVPGGDPLTVPGYVYWWVLFVFLLGYLISLLITRSPLGRSMRGIRDGDLRLRALGQRTYTVKLLAFTIAGGIAGMAGTAWTAQTRFISPGDMAFDMAAFALLAVVLGGAGTLWGPVIGAVIVIFVRDWLGGIFDGRGTLMLGITFVLGVYFLPKGVAGIRWRLRRRRTETDRSREDATT